MAEILTVRQLTEALRRRVEASFPFVWVKGEVSNLARPSSGHVYFSLKDSDALLNCVWFRGQQNVGEGFDPLTGEVFSGPRPNMAQNISNGQTIMCAGRISVYAPRGSYQLVVDLVQDAGLGALHLAFEKLKNKLAAQGFFEQGRKRPIPPNPGKVAVITAPKGAAIADFLRIAGERGCGMEIRIHPALVQGAGASETIVEAFKAANAEKWAELIVLIRGGGSLEDLWTFNEERVARAIFESALPVIAGIGHEVDVTIADLTADLRAATPSHAAQILWPARYELAQRLDDAEYLLRAAGERLINAFAERLLRFESALRWLSPMEALKRRALLLESLSGRLLHGFERWFTPKEEAWKLGENLQKAAEFYLDRQARRLDILEVRLQALDPVTPLKRGFALPTDNQGKILRKVSDFAPGEDFNLEVSDGGIKASRRP